MSERMSFVEESYSHEWLWRSSSALVSRLELDDEDAYHLRLPALLTAILAFEAFVNFCGLVVLPELWSDERAHFRGATLEDKLGRIVAKLPAFRWNKGVSPYQNIAKQLAFRDLAVHGKVHVHRYVASSAHDGPNVHFQHEWDPFLEIGAIKRARSDILEFGEQILAEMRKVTDNDPRVIAPAFRGALASYEGDEIVG